MSEIQHLCNIFHLKIFFLKCLKTSDTCDKAKRNQIILFWQVGSLHIDVIWLHKSVDANISKSIKHTIKKWKTKNLMYRLIREIDHDIHCTVNGANETKKEPLDKDNSPYNTECVIRSH